MISSNFTLLKCDFIPFLKEFNQTEPVFSDSPSDVFRTYFFRHIQIVFYYRKYEKSTEYLITWNIFVDMKLADNVPYINQNWRPSINQNWS